MEVATRSGVARPGAVGVVIQKVWAEAAAANVVVRKAAVIPSRRWRHGYFKMFHRAANREISLNLSDAFSSLEGRHGDLDRFKAGVAANSWSIEHR